MSQLLALTPGEPAGIGPDLTLLLASQGLLNDIVVIADPELLQARARALKLDIPIKTFIDQGSDQQTLRVQPIKLIEKAIPGQLNSNNAEYVLKTLNLAIDGCLNGQFSALVTAPLHKGVINEAGIAFTGHTEYLAMHCGGVDPVMMLASQQMKVALITTHLPLRNVADAITTERLTTVMTIINQDLKQHFGIKTPRLVVCGLNPHAGESGYMGREELDIIIPALEALRAKGLLIDGPLPADTAFTPAVLKRADVMVAMYHDQGLPVLKHSGFGQAVNITLGLPIIRTSVDHGTALEVAGTDKVNTGSLEMAIQIAKDMAQNNQSPLISS